MSSSPAAALQFLGAAGGVTGSKYLFSYGDDQLLIDCGLFQGLKELRQRNWAPVPIDFARLRAVILTHAHIDHSGYLPRIVAKGYRGPVFATPGTCDLLTVMLPDAAHLQEEEARYANRKGYSKHAPALPLYTVQDADRSLQLLRPIRNAQSVEVMPNVSLKFGRVGHILGAGSARLSFEIDGQQRTLLDSGDLGRYGRPILKGSGAGAECRLAADRVDLRQSSASQRFGKRPTGDCQRHRGAGKLFGCPGVCSGQNARPHLRDPQNGRCRRDSDDSRSHR